MEGTFGPNHERQERIATALRRIEGGSCHLMGVLNVTPDSFHKASRLATVEEAIASGLAMWRDGATWLDVGGESTRPGAEPVNPEQERQRVLPVIEGLRKANPEGMISIDTRRPSVARAALEAGADMVNDVSGLRDPEMVNLVLEASCAVCIMHMQGNPGTMQAKPTYTNCASEVSEQLLETARALKMAGHPPQLIALDPGIGFGKTLDHNIELLQNHHLLRGIEGYAVLWGVSRKSMIGSITGKETSNDRLAGTLGVAALAHYEGIDLLRVHDVDEHADLLKVLDVLS
jgi:dihydropteroate synthase